MKAEDLKFVVQEKYGEIAKQSKIQNETSCCGVGSSCCTIDYAVFAESTTKKKGIIRMQIWGWAAAFPHNLLR